MYYVIEDPKRQFWRGAMVTPAEAIILQSRGVKMLPVDKNVMSRNAITGLFVRDWGGGIIPHPIAPSRTVYGMMQVEPGYNTITWIAKIVTTETEEPSGSVRLYSDHSQAQTSLSAFGLNPITTDLSQVAEDFTEEKLSLPNGVERSARAWFIGGTAHVEVQASSLIGLGLWGSGQGIKIATLAVSQTK